MQKRIIIFLLTYIFAFTYLKAQSLVKDKDFFTNPIDTPLHLSGNFGELRPNHLHSGIDIKTKGRIGKNVYAVADGYVSRINISHKGYGNAVYITHPNGYVSVYAHLHKFNNRIESYIKKLQYKNETFKIDVPVEKWGLPVKQGEIIGLSGNSGSSEGPHLHFEIRDAKTEEPINPLLFNFAIKDIKRPIIQAIKIYPMDNKSSVEGENEAKKFVSVFRGNRFYLNHKTPIKLNGNVTFGILTFDYLDYSWSKCSPYSVELWVDSSLIYKHELSRFSFFETRYINSLLDYYEQKTRKRKYQKSFIEPNNNLSIYKQHINSGIFNFETGKTYNVSYLVKDTYGNTSQLSFKVEGSESIDFPKQEEEGIFMSYDKENTFKNEDFVFVIPKDALYDNIYFKYRILHPQKNSISKTIELHTPYVPIHRYCNLKIKVDSLPKKWERKLTIIALNGSNNKINSYKTTYEQGFACTRTRDFGKYTVVVDTVSPIIKPLNIHNNKDMQKLSSIRIHISDKISGIKSYKGTIDGRWVLFEYDAKKDVILYYFDEKRLIHNKTHNLEITVEDEAGNKSDYQAHFFW